MLQDAPAHYAQTEPRTDPKRGERMWGGVGCPISTDAAKSITVIPGAATYTQHNPLPVVARHDLDSSAYLSITSGLVVVPAIANTRPDVVTTTSLRHAPPAVIPPALTPARTVAGSAVTA